MDRQDPHAIERRTIAKVSWRLLPLVVVAYCIAYIDRSNISFAAPTMNKDLGFSAYIYGWGAGIFFFNYFLFEIPSNLIGGYFGPFVVGWIKDSTGSSEAGLYFLAACSLMCAVITLFAARAAGDPKAMKRANAARAAG